MTDNTKMGTVKFYLVKDGYGFITPEGCDPEDKTSDLFFHHSQLNVPKLKGAKFKAISQGTRVAFIPVGSDRGPAAMNVTPI